MKMRFRMDGDELIMRVDGEKFTSCFDVCSILCKEEAVIYLPDKPKEKVLVMVKPEGSPYNSDAMAIMAYFRDTPTEDDLLGALKTVYEDSDPDDCGYGPEQFQDDLADAAGLQRWFICQAV